MADLSRLADFYRVSDPSQAGDLLEQLRQYDPGATYVQRYNEGSQGTFGDPYYQLSFDPSKLPGMDGTGQLTGYNRTNDSSNRGEEWQGPNWMPVNDTTLNPSNGSLKDPSLVTHSSVYGDTTPMSNYQLPVDHSWLDYSPLLVAGFGGLMGGMPGLYEGVFGQGAFGGGEAGLGAADPFLSGGTGAMDMTGSYGTGLPGSLGSNLGGAESSLYGSDVLSNPGGALGGSGAGAGTTGGLTQAQWDEIIAGQPENGSFVGPNGTDPNGFTPGDYRDLEGFNAGLDNPSLMDRLRDALNPSNLSKLPGLLGGAPGAGGGGSGGGGNLLINAGGQQQKPQVEDAAAILAKLYGHGLLGARNG
jgi:hypothetical protein